MNKFFKGITCALVFAGLLSAVPTSANAAPKVIKVSTFASPGSSIYRSLTDMKAFIEEKTNGKYRLDIYDSFKLGTMEESYQGLGMGTLQLMVEGASNIGTFMPALSMFDLGFLFPNADVANEVLSGPLGKKICATAANKSVTPLRFVRYAFRNPFVAKDINSLADLKGAKIRASSSPMHMAMLKSMGMNPVPMPGSEVYTGLQQGVVDGFDVDFPFGFTSKWYEPTKAVAEVNHSYVVMTVFTSTKWWNKLPAEDKPIFEEAIDLFSKAQFKNQFEDEKAALEAFKKAGLKIYKPTDAEMAQLREQSKDIYKQFPKVNVELLNELRAEVARVAAAK